MSIGPAPAIVRVTPQAKIQAPGSAGQIHSLRPSNNYNLAFLGCPVDKPLAGLSVVDQIASQCAHSYSEGNENRDCDTGRYVDSLADTGAKRHTGGTANRGAEETAVPNGVPPPPHSDSSP